MTRLDWEVCFSAMKTHGWNDAHGWPAPLPGVCLTEMLALLQTPWDDVDRLLIDAETIGG